MVSLEVVVDPESLACLGTGSTRLAGDSDLGGVHPRMKLVGAASSRAVPGT